ncbi:hypothetical protein GF360_00175 [candidate division WWE3 bacterium]|nr:hypothetical protein [candidate division WWE3 bacterium]
MSKIRLFEPPDYLKDLDKAAAEARFGTTATSAMKAMHAGMVFFALVGFGIILLGLRIPGVENIVEATHLVSLWETVGAPWEGARPAVEWFGIVLGLCFTIKFFQALTEHFVRFVVGTLSLSISVREGMAFRRYIFKAPARIFFIMLGAGAASLWVILVFFGIRGWLQFLMPRFSVQLPMLVLGALTLASVGAFLIFPAMASKTHDREELLALVMESNFVHGLKVYEKMVKETVSIATPHLSQELVARVQAEGMGAIADWVTLPANKWTQLRSGLRAMGVAPEQLKAVHYKREGKRGHLAAEKFDGTTTIVDADEAAMRSGIDVRE